MINTSNNNPTRETLQENHWSRVKLWSETKIFLKQKDSHNTGNLSKEFAF